LRFRTFPCPSLIATSFSGSVCAQQSHAFSSRSRPAANPHLQPCRRLQHRLRLPAERGIARLRRAGSQVRQGVPPPPFSGLCARLLAVPSRALCGGHAFLFCHTFFCFFFFKLVTMWWLWRFRALRVQCACASVCIRVRSRRRSSPSPPSTIEPWRTPRLCSTARSRLGTLETQFCCADPVLLRFVWRHRPVLVSFPRTSPACHAVKSATAYNVLLLVLPAHGLS
jgi:hypothetical protein